MWFSKKSSSLPTLDPQRLEEAKAWCLQKPLSIVPNYNLDELRRKKLSESAIELHRRRRVSESIDPVVLQMFQEVDIWTLPRLDHQLRSGELKPQREIGGEVLSEADCQAVVDDVISRRSQLLAESNFPISMSDQLHSLGRLLACFPAENVADGAAMCSSVGFFDANDIPPWDTWVHFSAGELICWVPAILIPNAQEGIDANPVDCIHWAQLI